MNKKWDRFKIDTIEVTLEIIIFPIILAVIVLPFLTVIFLFSQQWRLMVICGLLSIIAYSLIQAITAYKDLKKDKVPE